MHPGCVLASRAPEAPLEAHGPIRQEPVKEIDEFCEPVQPFGHAPRLLAEDGCVPTLTAGADPGREPPAGEIVQREQLAGERHRMPEGGRGDQRAETDPGRNHGRRREGRNRCEPRRIPQIPPGEVVVGPGVIEPEPLGPRPFLRQSRQAVLRQYQDAQAHAPSVRQALSIQPFGRASQAVGGCSRRLITPALVGLNAHGLGLRVVSSSITTFGGWRW